MDVMTANPRGKEKPMITLESENSRTPEPETSQPKGPAQTRKESQGAEEGWGREEGRRQPKTARSNKKADVIALMKRAKGATLAEIMAITKWRRTPCAAS
jgi:Protein of unknown function (DUF3489)